MALSKAGYAQQGLWFLNLALQQFPEDLRILCSLIENRLLAGESDAAKDYTLQLLASQSLVNVKDSLERLRTEFAGAPIDVDLISPMINKAAQDAVTQLTNDSAIIRPNEDKPSTHQ